MSKKGENLIVGLDIGTTKICAIVGTMGEGGLDIVGIGTSPSRGMRKGVVINIESTVTAIRKALQEADGDRELLEAVVAQVGLLATVRGFQHVADGKGGCGTNHE